MGSSSSKDSLPAWAPASLPASKRPEAYLELRHPNGSVVHVVGTKRLDKSAINDTRALLRLAQPDSVLIELCEERIASTWELIQQGTVVDGALQRPLPKLSYEALRNDARLRTLHFWFWGLDVEAVAALLGTTVNATQAGAAAEASRLRAQTHQIDRRQSATLQRCAIAYLEALNGQVFSGDVFKTSRLARLVADVLAPGKEASRLSSRKNDDEEALAPLRARARSTLDTLAEDAAHAEADPRLAAVRNVLLEERDAIFAHRCWECLAHLGPGGVAVAVVAKDHLPGIQRHWASTDPDAIKALLQPRDAPAVLTATAPYLGLAALSTWGLAYVPRRGALLVAAPLAGSAFLLQQALAKYDRIRSNLQHQQQRP